ncbi:nuclear transport factor 2 family protein [Ekhidna sp.]|uniref:nuclear transport factor 2 family protein n=1 Tax=Ekhidna sp. TaxID=2608089 RepID=UPI00329A2AE9
MKLFCTLTLLIITFGCSEKVEPSRRDLNSAIELFNEAYVTADTSALARMITDNYVHTNNTWKSFGKEKWLSYMSARRKNIAAGILEVRTYLMDEYAVEQFENSAIVTARIKSSGIENGVEFTKQFRITTLWIYDGSRWLRAGFHDTVID